MNSCLRISVICFALFLVCAKSFSQINSDFASNDEGWTTPDAATMSHVVTGGNPAGHLSAAPFFIITGSGNIYLYFYFIAPGKYTGNRSGYYGGTLRFDLQQGSSNTPTQHAEVIIRNPTTALYYYPATPFQPPAPPAWTTFSVPMHEVGGFWKTTDAATGQAATAAEIKAVLTSLTSLEIRGLFRDANTTNRLDNVTFMPPILVTTQPSPVNLCEGGTATLNASATGNANILYRWQRETSPSVWTDVTNTGGYSGAATGTLSINTTGNFGAGQYRCRISGTAVDDQFTTGVTVTVNPLPASPSVTPGSSCGAAAVTLSAAGGVAGQYRWYTVAVGGSPVAGQTNSTYTTPVLSATTTYYAAINNGTCQSTRAPVIATINTPPAAPAGVGVTVCSGATADLSASGGVAGQYRWHTVSTGGTPIAGQTNANYTTAALSTTTTYYVSIHDGACESSRTPVTATVNAVPSPPEITGASSCIAASLSLTATGGSPGQYRWYSVSTGGTPIAGQVNDTYTTPIVSATTNYYVSINNGTCESARIEVAATIDPSGCNNEPPVITPTSLVTQIEGSISISLVNLLSDSDDNLDLTTLSIVSPPKSGATAIIDDNLKLVIDYKGRPFSGKETIVLQVCDVLSACVQQTFSIDVVGEIVVYNAISPNGDGRNPIFFLEYIENMADTRENHVTIFNRWGDIVWEGTNYDNASTVFTGTSKNGGDLPSGTYFYSIQFNSGRPEQSGYLALRR